MSIVYPPVLKEERTYGTASYGLTLEQLKYTCLEKATVVAVNYEANTIDIKLDSDLTSFTGVKYLCHTDIDYYSYLTNGRDIPRDPRVVFSNTAHCFMLTNRTLENKVTAMVVRKDGEPTSCTIAIPYGVGPCKGDTYWAYYYFTVYLFLRTNPISGYPEYETKIIIYDRFRNKFADIVNNAGTGLVEFPCSVSELNSWFARASKVSTSVATTEQVDLVNSIQTTNVNWWDTTLNDSNSDVTSVCTNADGSPTACDHNGIWRTDTTVTSSEIQRNHKSGTWNDVDGFGGAYYTMDTYGNYHERNDRTLIRKAWINSDGIVSAYEFWDTRTDTKQESYGFGKGSGTSTIIYSYIGCFFLGVEVASMRGKFDREITDSTDAHYTTNESFVKNGGASDSVRTEVETISVDFDSLSIIENLTSTTTTEISYGGGTNSTSIYEGQSLGQLLPGPLEYYTTSPIQFFGAITSNASSANLFLSYALAFIYWPLLQTDTYQVRVNNVLTVERISYEVHANFVLYDAVAYTTNPSVDLPPMISNAPGDLTNLMQELIKDRFVGDDDTRGVSYFGAPEIWVSKFDNRIRAF